jgi:hypothetical protein
LIFAGRGQGHYLAACQGRGHSFQHRLWLRSRSLSSRTNLPATGIAGTKTLKAGASAAPAFLQEGPAAHDQRLALKNLFVSRLRQLRAEGRPVLTNEATALGQSAPG